MKTIEQIKQELIVFGKKYDGWEEGLEAIGGNTLTELFGSISPYISWCKEEGVEPEKPYSGKFNLRLSPELHKEIAITAKKMNLSINNFVEKAIKDELAMVN